MDVILNIFKRFPFIPQYDTMDCGPACLCMICKYYGKPISLQYLRSKCYLTREGVSLLGLSEGAKSVGLECVSFRSDLKSLIEERKTPCILFWKQSHFVVLYDVKKHFGKTFFYIADPAKGKLKIDEQGFLECWTNDAQTGVVSFFEPTEEFNKLSVDSQAQEASLSQFISSYIRPFRKYFVSLLLALCFSSLLLLGLPFLTQILVDKGIKDTSISIITVVLISQIIIYAGATTMEIVRNWLVLYIGARVNINIISDYLKKIIRLPMSFFDTKFINDFYQRISDHSRIERFLTSQAIVTALSIVVLLIYLGVLMNYDKILVIIYISMTAIAIIWAHCFMSMRAKLDYFRFKYNSLNQDTINEMFQGIQDIKLNKFENLQINKWRIFQKQTFENNQKILQNEQFQMIGFGFITQIKTAIISFMTAYLVIEQRLTLGEMIAVSFIIGQLDNPISQLIEFFKSLQEAKLSLKRLLEVQCNNNEENSSTNIDEISSHSGIRLSNINFNYDGPNSPLILKDLTFEIPNNKITAIVGKSGCGKTTLLKLLLKLYNPNSGNISIGNINLTDVPFETWRTYCACVMQESFIFSETIARNIAMGDEEIDHNRLQHALKMSNSIDFVNNLPAKEGTIIGMKGDGLSVGQKQRLLLARAIYSQKPFIFLDEATSALDTVNEREIYENLNRMFENRTVVVIAHRLSTIKNANQIVVMDDGEVVEIGHHDQLMNMKGVYYNLIQNQLSNNEK